MNANSTDPMIGRLLDGRYQIRSRIARGGMATVYLATDERLQRKVAIKVMHGHLADDSKFKERFVQEARSSARLAHPNVVNVFDQGQDSDMAYLVMEYLPGITLRDLLEEHRILTTEQTLDIMEAVLAGLAAAHKAGIVHRDLKPENVLLADDGRIKIGDFGLARAASANTATGAALLGTIAYLSPELVTRGLADTRSDIYAIGIMMYEMLVGEQPFKGEQPMQIAYQHANEVVPSPSAANHLVPAELDDLVLWATSREPDDRPKDARVLLDQLYQTHSSLMTALPPTASTAVQRTMVLPSAPASEPQNSTADTQVFGAELQQVAAPAPTQVSENTTTLSTRATKRKKRGWWLVALIVLLVGGAAGAGWYFGAGPGSQVTIPDSIQNSTPAEARVILEDLGLEVSDELGEAYDAVIAVDLVANSDPAVGAIVANGSPVQLLISQGPRPLPVPNFADMTEDEARTAISEAPFTFVEPVVRQFDSEIEAGFIIDVLDADGASILGAENYGELQEVSLIVSAGSLPDVACSSVDNATQTLADLQLNVELGIEVFSDCDEGTVVSIDSEKNDEGEPRIVREGDTVTLITSRGPEPVQVPDVSDEWIAAAKAELESLDFVVTVITDIPQGFWNSSFAPVSGTDPGAGESLKRGSEVTLYGPQL
ncbi:Stk1 family PASTA domain-containing Ser/Thr kinase [Salinibacterium sp. UTAS2018]|uniref:Stk1 family PASTA domain-containing Ser/Thr kinase n=1 Tax=Salinibacterium sp. UTAS2018 TaxID=2508880 RepID=UPI0010098523|nr:Stk1 family PASTA domain-containing Ser/Thr kinase [Salinibacterium sp. UTAS2018]QAV69312.1 Stk1 family PASTA domain-containing Ser/Thr kinase [Salinibacterium sp. UTAS2018]